MWEKIKNFFKWIADHTGISWVARKISSGWKWLFGGKAKQNTSQHEGRSGNGKYEPAQANDQSKDHTTPKTLDDEVNPNQPTSPAAPDEPQGPVINLPKTNATKPTENPTIPNLENAGSDVLKNEPKSERIEISGERLGLVVSADKKDFILASKNPSNPREYLVYVKHAKGIHRITGPNLQYVDVGNEDKFLSLFIRSIATQDGKTVSGDPVEMKKMLGLDENKKFIEITGISRDPITVSKVVANGNTPNSETTGPQAKQHTVGDGLSVNA